MMRQSRDSSVAAVFVGAALLLCQWGRAQSTTVQITDSRPVADAAMRLDGIYGVPINYEDPKTSNSVAIKTQSEQARVLQRLLRDPFCPIKHKRSYSHIDHQSRSPHGGEIRNSSRWKRNKQRRRPLVVFSRLTQLQALEKYSRSEKKTECLLLFRQKSLIKMDKVNQQRRL